MKRNLSLSERVHKWFFVEEAKPRLIIGLCSSAAGAAVAITFGIDKGVYENGVLNPFSRICVIIVMFVVGISVGVVLCFLVGGIYNYRKLHVARISTEVGGTETVQKGTISNSEQTNLPENED